VTVMADKRYGWTPAGGQVSVARFFDAAGREAHSPQDANTIEVSEHTVEGDHLARTYLTRRTGDPKGIPASPMDDAMTDGDFAEQVKSTWDVWDNQDGLYALANTKDALLHALGWDALPLPEQRQNVAGLMILPSWERAPRGLVLDVEQWLEATRQAPAPDAPAPAPED
jgi:hypothetical protein